MNYLEKIKNDINSIKKIIKNSLKTINQYYKHSKDSKVKGMMFLLKKLIRLLYVQVMI